MDERLQNMLLNAPDNIQAEAHAVVDAVGDFESAVGRIAERLRATSADSLDRGRPALTAFGEVLERENEHEILAADVTLHIGAVSEKRRRLLGYATAIHAAASRLDQIAREVW